MSLSPTKRDNLDHGTISPQVAAGKWDDYEPMGKGKAPRELTLALLSGETPVFFFGGAKEIRDDCIFHGIFATWFWS